MPAADRSCLITTPLGLAECAIDNDGKLSALRYPSLDEPTSADTPAEVRLLDGMAGAESRPTSAAARETLLALTQQLSEYFAGRRRSFDLPLALQGTAFQLAVWDELARIAYGTTISYGELARRVDLRLGPTPATAAGVAVAAQPGGSLRIRAVGRANALNPLAIIVPCHRVIDSRGELTGYAGGLWRKQALLELEGARPAPLFRH